MNVGAGEKKVLVPSTLRVKAEPPSRGRTDPFRYKIKLEFDCLHPARFLYCRTLKDLGSNFVLSEQVGQDVKRPANTLFKIGDIDGAWRNKILLLWIQALAAFLGTRIGFPEGRGSVNEMKLIYLSPVLLVKSICQP